MSLSLCNDSTCLRRLSVVKLMSVHAEAVLHPPELRICDILIGHSGLSSPRISKFSLMPFVNCNPIRRPTGPKLMPNGLAIFGGTS